MKQELNLLKDIIQIAKYLAWQNKNGDELANEIINSIHQGKYNSNEGIWVQTEKALKELSE